MTLPADMDGRPYRHLFPHEQLNEIELLAGKALGYPDKVEDEDRAALNLVTQLVDAYAELKHQMDGLIK